MKKLTIENIGPIEHVDLDIKRVNIIIGPQSAGKSCVLKIACFWGQSENSVVILLSGYSFVSLRHETMASITDSIS